MTTAVLDREDLRETLARAMDVEPSAVTDDADFVRHLKVDSLLALEIVIVLEKKYGVKLHESEFGQLTSLRGTYDLLSAKLS
ncbi:MULTISPECIES: acyl carrier protein [Streptomyces]|uniref:acyl carrier protein n=1 Tax=Streptomyces TaxID=1883 RepID=UPI00165F1D21|nr:MULTISPECIES: acyl carrier protein [unclassified Streptomyces]QNQ36700.1 acyl carrier protein [Streptomyces sp. CB00271]